MIDQLWEYLAVAGVLLVALVGLMAGLVRGGKRRRTKDLPTTRPPVERPRGTKDYRSGTISLDRTSDHAKSPTRPSTRPSGGGRPSGSPTSLRTPPPREPASPTTEPSTTESSSGGAPTAEPGTVAPGAPATGATAAETRAPAPQEHEDFTPTIEDRSRPLKTPEPVVIPPAEEAPAEAEPVREPEPEPTSQTQVSPLPETPVEPTPVEPERVPEPEVAPEPEQQLDRPSAPADRMHHLRSRLAKSNNAIGKSLLSMLAAGELSEEDWEDVEDTLLRADLGVEATMELVEKLRHHVAVDGATDIETARDWLYADMLELVDPSLERGLAASRVDDRPACILVVGVNGTGKTTTVGKLARVLVANDRDVVLGAADTFRAAAADQLETWGARVGVPTVRSDRDGADPAAVAFDAVKAGQEMDVDCVLIDTAGRLHNKVGLMDELGKVKRVIEKRSPIDEVLLVIDATTGQNGLKQAEVFSQVVEVTGIVLTKLDGTAKGGIVVAVQRQLGVPVKLVGLGEGPDDLAPFDPEVFVDAIVEG